MHGGEEEAGERAGLWPDGWGIWKAFCLGGQKEYWYIWFGCGGYSEFIIDVVFCIEYGLVEYSVLGVFGECSIEASWLRVGDADFGS